MDMDNLRCLECEKVECDNCLEYHRDDYYFADSKRPGIADVIIAKGRNYGTGNIELRWHGEYTKFANIDEE